MEWLYQDKIYENTLQHEGFVYLIENLTTQKKYIGKKTFWARRKGKGKIESDWRKYFGSSKVLLEDVTQLGKDNFKREILYLCKTKSEMTYLELREQIDRRVLESPEYYNDWISVNVRKSNIHGKL